MNATHYSVSQLPTRLQNRITIDGAGCWLWDSVRVDGYTQVAMHGKKWLGHRLTYTLLVGRIADGLQIDHLCRVQRCVNPAHLEAVTPLVNTRRSHGNNAKTHCPRGHEYTPENTLKPEQRLHRQCRTCKNARNRAWSAANRRSRRKKPA